MIVTPVMLLSGKMTGNITGETNHHQEVYDSGVEERSPTGMQDSM